MNAEPVEQGEEPSIVLLVSRVLGVAALVVAASAALFVGLAQFGDDEVLVVADAPEEAEEAEPEPEPEPEAPDTEDPAEPEPAPEPDDDGADEDGAAGEDAPDADDGDPAEEPGDAEAEDDDAAAEEGDGQEGPEPEPQEPDRIDPGSISVQVLDGFQDDGGSAADAVAAELADAGYRIIARNPALRYEVTAVLWTAGNEAAGQQIARDIGAAEVREQPGNLSTSVMVHVVVGADRG